MPVHDWTRVSANIFHDFHTAWMGQIRRTLNMGVLPPEYFAAIEQHSGDIVPDVLTLRIDEESPQTQPAKFPLGTTAVAERPPKASITARGDINVFLRRTVTIRYAEDERIVALIEVLSPGNKRSRSELDRFLDKAATALREGLHLMLIDVFPPGRHDPNGIHGELWDYIVGTEYHQPSDKPLTVASYSAGRSVTAYIEPFAVGDPVPTVPLFLAEEYYVDVPLEQSYQATWEAEPRPWQRRVSEGENHS